MTTKKKEICFKYTTTDLSVLTNNDQMLILFFLILLLLYIMLCISFYLKTQGCTSPKRSGQMEPKLKTKIMSFLKSVNFPNSLGGVIY